ncbi:hypothetical protein AAFN75_17735 [Algibacter sp. AS12]|uniref:hypothetical protein n=1 Tax=Algibacter sp. AS12 TaxID=3135773 RepID=UPI00398AFA40
MRKKIILFISVLFFGFISFLAINRFFFDIKEWWIMKENIIWSKKTELKWNDFIYDESKTLTDNIQANIGISARYRIDDKIYYKTKTAFVPEKSFVNDTTNPISLRIANTRFDLCEVYRRKLEYKIDSLRKTNIKNIDLAYLEKQSILYTNYFSEEWNEFLKIPKENLIPELEKLENKIRTQLNNNK